MPLRPTHDFPKQPINRPRQKRKEYPLGLKTCYTCMGVIPYEPGDDVGLKCPYCGEMFAKSQKLMTGDATKAYNPFPKK